MVDCDRVGWAWAHLQNHRRFSVAHIVSKRHARRRCPWPDDERDTFDHESEGGPRPTLRSQRQAAGVPSAWSQPFQSTHERPRRWCDAGSLGRISVTAAQKAGVEETTFHVCSADLCIVMTRRARIHRTATPTRGGLVAGAEAPAYSSESTIALPCRTRDSIPARNRRQPGWLSLHHPEQPLCSDRLPACRRPALSWLRCCDGSVSICVICGLLRWCDVSTPGEGISRDKLRFPSTREIREHIRPERTHQRDRCSHRCELVVPAGGRPGAETHPRGSAQPINESVDRTRDRSRRPPRVGRSG